MTNQASATQAQTSSPNTVMIVTSGENFPIAKALFPNSYPDAELISPTLTMNKIYNTISGSIYNRPHNILTRIPKSVYRMIFAFLTELHTSIGDFSTWWMTDIDRQLDAAAKRRRLAKSRTIYDHGAKTPPPTKFDFIIIDEDVFPREHWSKLHVRKIRLISASDAPSEPIKDPDVDKIIIHRGSAANMRVVTDSVFREMGFSV